MKISYALLAIIAASIFALSSCKSAEMASAKGPSVSDNSEKAAEMVQPSAAEKPGGDAEAHFRLGVLNSNKDDMAGAYREFMEAAKLDPKKRSEIEAAIKANWEGHYNAGMSESESGDIEGTAHELALATQADPRRVKGWLGLAKAYYAMAENDSTYMGKVYAVVDTMLAMNKEQDSNYGNVLAFEGRILAKQGRGGEAVKIFEELLDFDPTAYQAVEESGIQCLNRKDWQSGADLFTLVIAAQEKGNLESLGPYYNLGVACLNLKEYTKAIEALTEALRIEPENQRVHYYLLLASYQGDQLDGAIYLGRNYTDKYPDDQNGWRVLSLAYNKKGMTIKAQEAAKKAAELDINNTKKQ